jgi:hypothetical protein
MHTRHEPGMEKRPYIRLRLWLIAMPLFAVFVTLGFFCQLRESHRDEETVLFEAKQELLAYEEQRATSSDPKRWDHLVKLQRAYVSTIADDGY